MESYDVKRALPALYAPRSREPHVVEVPEQLFLTVDGHGDPNTSPDYHEAVRALFTLSYAVRAVAKAELGRVHVVGPLEGLWSADDPRVFTERTKSAWDWTMAISQPPYVTAELVQAAVQRRADPALDRVRLVPYEEGRSVQVLHVGPYDDEGPVLARLHAEYLPEHGLTFGGRHHEVYLSDPRRTEPARLRTVLRQPVVALPP